MIQRLLTMTEAAERVGVHWQTLSRWERRGLGPPRIKYSGRVWYPGAMLEEWLAKRKVPKQRESNHVE